MSRWADEFETEISTRTPVPLVPLGAIRSVLALESDLMALMALMAQGI